MSSVSGVTSSNSSSLYGSRNVLSGLATGMDTETMIENAVSGYQTKISSLEQKQTSLTWKQEAIRNISTPMIKFAQTYTSYTSSTNLLSASYFNKAVTTTTNGTNASKVSATGKTSSDVQILGVKQLATNSTYSISATDLGFGGSPDMATIVGSKSLDLSKPMPLSNVSGTMTLSYGSSRTISLSFDDLETYSSESSFVDAINAKLASTAVTTSSGENVAASTMVKATLGDDGTVTFTDNQNAGNTVTITDATGKLKTTLGIDPSAEASSSFTIPSAAALVDTTGTVGSYLSGKTFSMTVDGKTKTITMPTYSVDASASDAEKETARTTFISNLEDSVQSAFGMDVHVSLATMKDADGNDILNDDGNPIKCIQITGQQGSAISISATSAVGGALGLGGSTATSYLDKGKTLGELLERTTATDSETLGGITGTALKSTTTITLDEDTGRYYDADGNLTDSQSNRLGRDGKQLYGYDFEISGKMLTFTRDTAMESVLTAVNSKSVGLTASFSKTTNKLQLTTQETGAANQIVINHTISGSTTTNLAALLFGAVNDPDAAAAGIVTSGKYTAGTDAILSMSVNGVPMENIKRMDNNFDVDGLSVTLKGTFGNYTEDVKDAEGKVTTLGTLLPGTEAVSFSTAADSDKIVSTITDMVKDLNDILKTVHDAYSATPNYKRDKSRYEPLTDDDKKDMSDSDIKSYEEKAKQGILFNDSDLSSLYSKLLSAISPGGTASNTLSKIGITTTYSDGVTSIKVDEDALRDALSNNPDSVRDAFTFGSSGLMVNVSKVMSSYAATTGSTKGILVQKAGSIYSPLSLLSNSLQDQINNYDDQIDKWQDRLSDKVDYYTKMFTRLEQLTNSMNSQSSMISSMLGS
ncbi:flagellar hook-associated protein 2 [Oscillibacter valericigenes Sjm18-20]|nr:flagellar hook-associated protein 2 [Oscillibacter valericigenes Sjm18-20]